jgi:hypothetical protein
VHTQHILTFTDKTFCFLSDYAVCQAASNDVCDTVISCTMDWKLCCLCQTVKTEDLRCPTEEGLLSLERDLNDFMRIASKLPKSITVSMSSLDDGSGIASTLRSHSAGYHKSCRSCCNSTCVKRLRQKEVSSSNNSCSTAKKLRSSEPQQCIDAECWVICLMRDEQTDLHKASTFNVDSNLRRWATTSSNHDLLSRLTMVSDAVAADHMYHTKCYMALKRASEAVERATFGPAPPTFDAIASAQIVVMMESSEDSVFKLSDLRSTYEKLLSDQAKTQEGRYLHITRFKCHILEQLGPEWCAINEGKHVYLTHNGNVAKIVAAAHSTQSIDQDDALLIMRAAVLLRNSALQKLEPFNGSFPPTCLTSQVPANIMAFMKVVVGGPSTLHNSDTDIIDGDTTLGRTGKIAATLSQLLIYNTWKGTHHATKTTLIRHSTYRETFVPLYQGLKLHGAARLKTDIDTAHTAGLSVSYGRVMEVKLGIARAVCAHHVEDGVVVPTNIRQGVFTSHDVDNLDGTTKSNFSQDEFHGTALSATNHISREKAGVKRAPIQLDPSDVSTPKLPDSYSIVPQVELNRDKVYVPLSGSSKVRPSHNLVNGAKVKDEAWMAHVTNVLEQDMLCDGDVITWSGFNSQNMTADSVKPRAEVGVFPLFADKAATPSMMKHAMEMTKVSTAFLNPGQTPVLGADQPLFALLKQIQWQYPETLGEDKLVVVMGALHIEDKAHLMIGKLLRDSGWSHILSEAQVLTSGRAQSALNEHHIKRTRYAHQVTLMSLHLLKRQSYCEYASSAPGPCESFDMWNDKCKAQVPQFNFWNTIMELELLISRFVRSLREGDFRLYIQACDELCEWFTVMDHTNYARWLPVHVRDMVLLEERNPDVFNEFCYNGNFTVQKGEKKFSLMAKDQGHEQSNKILQAHGGAVGLYQNPQALALYMLAGPDSSRIVQEFEAVLGSTSMSTSCAHNEEAHTFQVRFRKDVLSFRDAMACHGNPFSATGTEMFSLDTQTVMEPEVAISLSQIHIVGQSRHKVFVTERLEAPPPNKVQVPLSDTIPKNNVYTFANRPNTKQKQSKNISPKQNLLLVTRMFLSLQSRPDADMLDFFQYENQREPPSLADRGTLRAGSKSDILECIRAPTCRAAETTLIEKATVVVLDMAAVIHMVRPTAARTFSEYVPRHILPFLEAQMNKSGSSVRRVDAVWDNYPENSLKGLAHARRGTGHRTRIGDGSTPIPKEWNNYLKNEENKTELFGFISDEIAKEHMSGNLLLSTKGTTVLSNQDTDCTALEPCNHSEADTRIILHLHHAATKGHTIAYIRTVDSDVIVLAVGFWQALTDLGMLQLWAGFGTGKNYRDIPIHAIYSQLSPSRSLALPLFHSLTGCDTTSAFLGCGKKTAWAAWTATPNLSNTLIELTQNPDLINTEPVYLQRLEQFVVNMYSRGSQVHGLNVNEARLRLFSSGQRSLENIPPTQAALLEHVKRALLQASFFWKQATSAYQAIPDFSEWGWKLDDAGKTWLPFWSPLADAGIACSLLLQCGCTKSCRGNCKCSRAGVHCSVLCKCEGGCCNNNADDDSY